MKKADVTISETYVVKVSGKLGVDPRITARYAHVLDMAKRNPALFIPVKVGR